MPSTFSVTLTVFTLTVFALTVFTLTSDSSASHLIVFDAWVIAGSLMADLRMQHSGLDAPSGQKWTPVFSRFGSTEWSKAQGS